MTKKVRLFLTMLFLTLLGGANAAWAEDVTDVLNRDLTGVTGTSYTNWSGKTSNSTAFYAGNSAGGNESIQLRSKKNESGIVSTVSGGKVKKVTVIWNNNTVSGRTLNVYGKNTAYSAASDLYGDNQGTLLGTIVCGSSTELTISDDYEFIGFRSADGAMYLTSVSITWSGQAGKKTAEVTINKTSFAIGEFATVSTNGPALTLSTDDATIASVSGTTVTGESAGSTTITASWSEDEEYEAGSKEFTITVTDPNAPGTASNPYTVADAIAYINTLGSASSPNDVYVSGIISQVDSYNPNYHSITYWISDEGTTSTPMEVYSGKGLDGADFSSIADLQVGDIVTVCGVVKMYNTTPEFDKNNKLVSFERPASVVEAPVFTPEGGTYSEAQSVEITCAKENATIYYTIDGKDPTNESTEYTGAITVSETTTIKAIAYVGTDASQIASAKYTIEVPGEVVIVEDDKITFLFNTPANEWGFPVGSSNKLVNETEYTANGYTIKVAASSEGGFYYNNSGYLLLGKFGAHITLPAFNFPVSKIDVVGSSSASEAVRQNIFVNGAEVSKETTGAKNVTNSYIISSACQAAGNIYTLKVTNNYNTQVTKIIVYKGEELNVEDYYLVGSFNNWTKQDNDYKFTTTDGVTYTLADVEFDANTTFKVIDSVEGDNTTWYGGNTGDTNYKIHRDWCTDIETAIPGKDFLIETAGTYNFTFTIQDEGNPQISVTGWPEVEYYLTGDFNNWAASDDDYKFTKQNDGTYKLTTKISGNFKVYDSLNHKYGATADGSYWITADNHTDIEMTDQAANYYLETANDYTFIVNPDTKKLTVTGWPIVLDGNAFVKVTSTDDLTDGYYLIVNEENSVAFNGALDPLDAEGNKIDVSIVDNELIIANNTTNAAAFVISNATGGYTITSTNGQTIGNSSDANGLKIGDYMNAITIDNDGNADIACASSHLRFYSTVNNKRFRYYKSSTYKQQSPVQLYKLTTVEEIPVTIGSTGYGTLYYSDKALAIPEGMTAQYVSQVGDNDGKITFTEINNHFIPKNTAVVLQADPKAYTFLVIPDSEAEAPMNNLLSGTDEAATTVAPDWAAGRDCKFYMLSKKKGGDNSTVGFYYGSGCPNGEAFTNGAHKAYLTVPKMSGANARSFYLFSDAETTTGIDNVQSAKESTGNLKIYNLNGQRVSTPQRGIYIVNGKKVLVK